MKKAAAELFWPRVAIGWTDQCWEWTGPILNNGYGQFGTGKTKGLSTLAHRASYQMIKGDPGELVVDHTCRNRKCVNPGHLNGHSNWKQYSYRRKCLDCAREKG